MEVQASVYGGGTDLGRYFAIVIRRWPLLLLFAVLAAASGFLYTTWQEREPVYQATAVVVMGRQRYVLNLDSRVQAEQQAKMGLSSTALSTLARSDDVLNQVLSEVNQAFPEANLSLGTLRAMLYPSVSKDESQVTLKVQGKDPALVAKVANVWAKVFAAQANEAFGVSEVLNFFEAQVARAKEELDKAQQAKVAFEARDELTVLESEHEALKTAHKQYLAEKRRIESLLQDVGLLQAQLQAQVETRPLTSTLGTEDQVAILGLVLKSQDANVKTSIPAGIGGVSVKTDRSLAEGLAILKTLEEGLRTKLAYLDTKIAEVGPALTKLQQRMEALRGEEQAVEQAYTLAEEVYNLARRGLEEARIMAADTATRVRVASSASVPSKPMKPSRRLQNTLLAAALGLVVGAATALLLEYPAGRRQAGAGSERAQARETSGG